MADEGSLQLSEKARRDEIMRRVLEHPLAVETTSQRLERMVDVAGRRLNTVTVVLENLWDPHNFSAIVRSAEALGLGEAHVIESVHRYRRNPSVLRGADRWLDVERHGETRSCLEKLRGRGFVIACADVGQNCLPLGELPADRPLALVVGSEQLGLSDDVRDASDLRFTVPMAGFSESFNVSVSAALALYEVTRQRRLRIAPAEGELDSETAARTIHRWLESTRRRRSPSHLRDQVPTLES